MIDAAQLLAALDAANDRVARLEAVLDAAIRLRNGQGGEDTVENNRKRYADLDAAISTALAAGTGATTVVQGPCGGGDVRVLRNRRWDWTIFIGPWATRIKFDRSGRFGNGSRFWSGIHRWKDDPDV